MRVYKFDKREMRFKPVNRLFIVAGMSVCVAVGFSLKRIKTVVMSAPEQEIQTVVLEQKPDVFSVEALREEMKRCGIKFPNIVMAQARLESGNFRSRIFREANNLFGMKLARSRNTTAIGEFSGHALYENWRQSVMDYSLYQSTYLRKIRTEEQYLEYLSQSYAESPTYVEKIKKMI